MKEGESDTARSYVSMCVQANGRTLASDCYSTPSLGMSIFLVVACGVRSSTSQPCSVSVSISTRWSHFMSTFRFIHNTE